MTLHPAITMGKEITDKNSNDRYRFRFELESFFYRTIPPLTYKNFFKLYEN